MANKHKVNSILASELREIGWTYVDIAEHLNCSVDWCKHNLRGIKKNKNAMKQVVNMLAIENDPSSCITCGVLFTHGGDDDESHSEHFCSDKCYGKFVLEDEIFYSIYGEDA